MGEPGGPIEGRWRRPPAWRTRQPLPAHAAAEHDLVPVGATVGYLLLELLSLNGWRIHVHAAPAGGVQVTAQRDNHIVTRTGATVADIATGLLEEASTIEQQGDRPSGSTRRGCA